jgi:signal transduction histidine kinase
MLDEAGLCMALRTFIEGFEERSRIGVATDLPGNFERLSPEMETALFRIVQECLTNVHRHSGSKDASIRLARENGSVVLEVADVGRGIFVLAIGFATNNGQSGGTRSAQEVARVALTHQTGAIAQTALLNPPANGAMY